MADVSEPAFELAVITSGLLEGMRPATARDTHHRALRAFVELQARGEAPTIKALGREGVPIDNLNRLMSTDLSWVTLTQLRIALDERIVDSPERILLDARTERSTGPDKFPIDHVQKPPGVGGAAPTGASNTVGGIASAIALADCGDVFMPCGHIQIPQGWWLPSSWIGYDHEKIERELRERARYDEPFIQTPEEIVSALLAQLEQVEILRPWGVGLASMIVGGHLSLGHPRRSSERYGSGRIDRYTGTDLAAIALLCAEGRPAFFEMPHRAGEPVDACPWTLNADRSDMSLREVIASARRRGAPWIDVPSPTITSVDGVPRKVRRLPVRATHGTVGPLPLQLVFVIEAGAASDMFVTTLEASDDEAATANLARLAAREAARRRPGSPMELSIQSLLRDGHLQTNARRRYPERRGYGALAAMAFGVLQVARLAA